MVVEYACQGQATRASLRASKAKYTRGADVVGWGGQVDDERLGEEIRPLVGGFVLPVDEDIGERGGRVANISLLRK